MAKRRVSKFATALTYIIVILLVVAVIGGVVYFTKGLTTDFKSFFGVIDGEVVLDSISGVNLSVDNPLKVDVKYTFSFADKDLTGYRLEIVANPEYDFEFKVDGAFYSFKGDSIDWMSCFDVEYHETSFTLIPKADCVSDMLRLLFDGKTVEFEDDWFDFTEVDLFILNVYSYNDKAFFSIGLNISKGLRSLTLDKTEIVF